MFLELVIAANIGYGQPIDSVQASCIASAIYHEARDQPLLGQAAVAQVILNRMEPRGRTACGVVKQYKQFSFTLSPYSERLAYFKAASSIDNKAKHVAVQIALQSLTGTFNGVVNGAMHYYNPAKANPAWKSDFNKQLTIGDHLYVYK